MNWAGIGEALVIVVAAFVATRHLPLAAAVAAGFAYAAGTADAGYWLGSHGGRPFIEQFGSRLRLRPEQLAGAELFFSHHGATAVLAQPFVIGMRTWGAMLAGMSRMPFWRFQILSAAAGLVWAAAVGLAGYVVGSNLGLLEALVRSIGVGGVVFVVVIVSFLLVAQERATRRR